MEEIDKCESVSEAVEFLKYQEDYPEASLADYRSSQERYFEKILSFSLMYGASYYTFQKLFNHFMQQCRKKNSSYFYVGTATGRLSVQGPSIRDVEK